MIVVMQNVWARVEQASTAELRWLDEYLSCTRTVFTGSGASLTPNTQRLSMLGPGAEPVFPAGLVRQVSRDGRREGHYVEVVDDRPPVAAPDYTADVGWLRDYQSDAVNATAHHARGLIKVPTGGGKTEIFIGLTRVVPVEWLFVVHRADIVAQAAARYNKRTGERAGTFEGGTWNRGTCNVTVSTFQALYKALKDGNRDFLETIEGVNVDESHAQPADSFYDVTMAMPRAYYRVGQSGTPLHRGDYESLRRLGALGPVVYKIPTKLLIERGVLSKATIRMVRCEQSSDKASWASVYKQLVVASKRRNDLVAELAEGARKPALLFVDQLAHGHQLVKLLRARGIRADVAFGDNQLSERQRKVRALENGEIDVLVCNVIFQEGIDIPALKSVVVAAGKSAATATIQRLGRGMRTCADGDDTFELWDVFDTGQKWLAQHSRDRRAAYESEEHEVWTGELHEVARP